MDAVLGLIGLALFVVAVIALAAALTWGVIRVLPAKDRREKAEPAS